MNDSDRTGADLLDELRQAITYYTVFPTAEAADAVVLWIATTYAVSVFDAAPQDPLHRAGKALRQVPRSRHGRRDQQ